MALLRWDPWGELSSLQRDMNELFSRQTTGVGGGALLPSIDAYRTEDGMVVQVELPGLSEDDIDVSVHDGMLTIAGERKFSQDVPDDSWIRRERAFGRFERSFGLPQGTNPEEIQANFENGVLELTIPHPEELKPRRIQVAGGGQKTIEA